ncbi:putative transmembrane protein [Toxoplasma gondii VEG]|uniref:Transmembrane protein n=2 Tax=Toxoplasma gondii (strain ATCC 50861 / VEG) TaxID=432359 RepID=V4ZFE0_TOXGV|nr:putative transmembrane protein [Toxoplasma gondii VEG]
MRTNEETKQSRTEPFVGGGDVRDLSTECNSVRQLRAAGSSESCCVPRGTGCRGDSPSFEGRQKQTQNAEEREHRRSDFEVKLPPRKRKEDTKEVEEKRNNADASGCQSRSKTFSCLEPSFQSVLKMKAPLRVATAVPSLLALSSVISLQRPLVFSLPLESVESSPASSPFDPFSPFAAPVSPHSAEPHPFASSPFAAASPAVLSSQTLASAETPASSAGAPIPAVASHLASRAAAAEEARDGLSRRASQVVSLLQSIPLEVTVIENKGGTGELLVHSVKPHTPPPHTPPPSLSASAGEAAVADLDAVAPPSPAADNASLQRLLSEEDAEDKTAGSDAKSKSSRGSGGVFGRGLRWLKEKVTRLFMRFFNPTTLSKKGAEARVIDNYLKDAAHIDAELKCVEIRDEKSMRKEFQSFCKKFRKWPKLQALCTSFSEYIQGKLADKHQCKGLDFRQCMEVIDIPLLQPLYMQTQEVTVHRMKGEVLRSGGEVTSPKRRRSFSRIEVNPHGPASAPSAEFVLGVPKPATDYVKDLLSNEKGASGSYQGPSCLFLEEVDRNSKAEAHAQHRANQKGRKDRVHHLIDLYKIVHLAELGTPVALDGMFLTLLTHSWKTKHCPNEVRKLRRQKRLLKQDGGPPVKVTGGDIFNRALLLAVIKSAIPTPAECLESQTPSRNCLAMIYGINLERPWRTLLKLAAENNKEAALKLIDELPQTLQGKIPSPADLERVRSRLTEQAQQVFSLASGSGRAGRKVMNVLAKWKWLLKMMTKLVVFLSNLQKGGSDKRSVAAEVGKRLAAKGGDSAASRLVTDGMLLEMASRSGANMKCVTALPGYGRFVEDVFRGVASAELRQSRQSRGSKSRDAHSFVSLGDERDTQQSLWPRDSRDNTDLPQADKRVLALPGGDATALSFLGDEDESDSPQVESPKQTRKTSRHRKISYVVIALCVFLFIQAVIATPTGVAIFIGVLLSVVSVVVYFLPDIIKLVRNRSTGGGGEEEDELLSGGDGGGDGDETDDGGGDGDDGNF